MRVPTANDSMPVLVLPTPVVPVPAVPIQLPTMTMPSAPDCTTMPSREKRVIIRPRTVLASLVPVNTRPSTAAPAEAPSMRISGVPTKPGCVLASSVTWPVICGSAAVSEIVCTPAAAMLKPMLSAPALAFASMSAWRSDPAPALLVLTTV